MLFLIKERIELKEKRREGHKMNSIIGRVKKQISTGGNFYEFQEEVEKKHRCSRLSLQEGVAGGSWEETAIKII